MEVKKTKEDIERDLTEANRNMAKQEFPKMLYHPEGQPGKPEGRPPVIVNSKEEQAALGDEWQESPQDAIDLFNARNGDSKAAGKTTKTVK
jgi:hypothetical protein